MVHSGDRALAQSRSEYVGFLSALPQQSYEPQLSLSLPSEKGRASHVTQHHSAFPGNSYDRKEPWTKGPGIRAPALATSHLLCDLGEPSCPWASAQLQVRQLRSSCYREPSGHHAELSAKQPEKAPRPGDRSSSLPQSGHQAQVRGVLTSELLSQSPHLTSVSQGERTDAGTQRGHAQRSR